MSEPRNNLDLFSTLYKIWGILLLVFSLFPLIYAIIGGSAFVVIDTDDLGGFPFNPGIIFLIIGFFGFAFLVTIGILNLRVSNSLSSRTNYTLTFAMGIVNCLTGILGIVLGIFTLVEINKQEVKQIYGR